jgi:stage V sporulation protein G
MKMKVTEVRIRPADEEFVKAYASICFDDCFLVHDIRVIKGPTGLFISFPNRTQSERGQRDIAFPVNAETRDMIDQAILAQYEKIVGRMRPSPKRSIRLLNGSGHLSCFAQRCVSFYTPRIYLNTPVEGKLLSVIYW